MASGPSSPTQDNNGPVTMLPSALPAIDAFTEEPLPDVVIPALGFVICQSRVTLTVQDAGIGFENVDCTSTATSEYT